MQNTLTLLINGMLVAYYKQAAPRRDGGGGTIRFSEEAVSLFDRCGHIN